MICKWNILITDGPQLIGSGRVLLVAQQDPTDLETIQIWTDEDGSEGPIGARNREVYVYGTGMTPDQGSGAHLGSVVCASGKLVWHVYSGPTYTLGSQG